MADARIPGSTYRLQFHAGFTFRDAKDVLAYLDELGISDVYASPYFQAAPDSTHGYDVANHNRLNLEIGDASDFRAFTSELRTRGMGHVLDFVPNHMGIGRSLNTWWMGVLEDGIESPYATYFDIDWNSGKEELADRVMLPILGERYGTVLENKEFKLGFEDGSFVLRYWETWLPLAPRSYPLILRRVLSHLGATPAADKLAPLIDAFAAGPPADAAKRSLAAVVLDEPEIGRTIKETLRALEGEAGKPASFDALHDLLEAQAYRLSYWRVAAEEINYRRFFDINTLAAIRVEIPEVFEASHQFVFELLARGDVTGLRIDHIDGLWDPRSYLARLQDRYGQFGGTPLYLIVEKILDPTREQLPVEWPVHGTTGYEFTNQVAMVFVDSAAEKRITKTYERFSEWRVSFKDLVYEKKKLTMQISLRGEIAALGRMLDELSEMHRHFRDFTRNTLTAAVREVIACFPVYRTYATSEDAPSPADEEVILRAIQAARHRNPVMEYPVLDFLRGVLLLRLPGHLSAAQREAHVHFVMKFQQCSGPVMAKGLEDTAFYIFNRLAALNEVGGDPGIFGIAPSEFHRLNVERHERLPHALLATSTHDTKRSEDVRMRLVALSELPEEWGVALRQWRQRNKKFRTLIEGAHAPSGNEEYLLYQTLLGSWPLAPDNPSDYVERIQQYMIKALKEAKINSSWTEPNEAWEQAVSLFVERILDPARSAAFLASFNEFADKLAPLGAMNALSQTVLKCTLPGIPDFYQGSEIWDFSLVDPDNRRPVDYDLRRRLLASLRDGPPAPANLLQDWRSGRIKLHVCRKLLGLRRENPEFFRKADYQPIEVVGGFAKHAIAFSRKWKSCQLMVVVPRLTASMGGFPLGETWKDTALLHAMPDQYENILAPDANPQRTATNAALSDLLAEFPVGVFFSKEAAGSPQ